MLEKHFQQKVITVAHYYGWLVQHTRAVNSEGRWMTPISGDAGFVDLTLVHPTRGLIFAELKSRSMCSVSRKIAGPFAVS